MSLVKAAYKGENVLDTRIHFCVLPDCGCRVSCLRFLPCPETVTRITPFSLRLLVKCLITSRRKVTNTEEEMKFQNLEQTSYWELDHLPEMSD